MSKNARFVIGTWNEGKIEGEAVEINSNGALEKSI
jgi:hypothetical protein